MTDGKRRRSSRRGRERSQKATKEPLHHMMSQKSCTDHQDFPFTPSRYQTRRSSAVLDHVMPSSLRPAMRILNKKQPGDEPLPSAKRDIKMPELHHYSTSSQPNAAEDIVCEYTAEKGVDDTSVSTRSPTWSASASMHQVPLHCRENNYVDKPENGTMTNYVDNYCQGLNESRSLNITEYAKRLQDELDDDPEEIESALDPAFDCVNGHKVKVEIAPLLRAIFEKYGDITEGSPLISSSILSLFLEHICVVYQRLEQMKFLEVTCIQLNDLLDQVRDFEHLMKMNVGWLRERIEFISETKIRFEGYCSVKQEVAKSDASIGSLEQEVADLRLEVADLQHKLAAKEAKLVEEKAKANEIQTMAFNIRDRVNTLTKQGLVHGLL